jgi:competence protein ComEA
VRDLLSEHDHGVSGSAPPVDALAALLVDAPAAPTSAALRSSVLRSSVLRSSVLRSSALRSSVLSSNALGSGDSGPGATTSQDLGSRTVPAEAPRPGGPVRRPPLGQRLLARVPLRLDPGRRAATAIGLAVLVAAVLTGLWVLSQRPRALAVSASPPAIPGAVSPVGTGPPSPAPTMSAASAPATSSTSVVVVDVAGKVHRPGLYRLPAGSRVDDAVKAAGGPLRPSSLGSLNLAARVVDGQQIVVGAAGAPVAGVPVAGGGAGDGSGGTGVGAAPVDLNTATLEQLESLPGVGPVLGQQILDWRSAHGTFATVDQLNDVTGIGEVKFAALKPLVTV